MGFFDGNNPEHKNLADAFNNGNYGDLPQGQVMSHYQSFLQNAPQDEVNEVHQEYFNQMPQAEKMGLFSGLMNTLNQNGIDPRQAGVRTTNPQQASSSDLGNLFNFAMNSGLLGGLLGGGQRQPMQQPGLGGGLGGMLGGLLGGGNQQPDYGYQQQPGYNQQPMQNQGGGLQGLLSNPLAQAAISGLIGYAANRAINGFANGNQGRPAPQQPQNNWGQGQDFQDNSQNFGNNQQQMM